MFSILKYLYYLFFSKSQRKKKKENGNEKHFDEIIPAILKKLMELGPYHKAPLMAEQLLKAAAIPDVIVDVELFDVSSNLNIALSRIVQDHSSEFTKPGCSLFFELNLAIKMTDLPEEYEEDRAYLSGSYNAIVRHLIYLYGKNPEIEKQTLSTVPPSNQEMQPQQQPSQPPLQSHQIQTSQEPAPEKPDIASHDTKDDDRHNF